MRKCTILTAADTCFGIPMRSERFAHQQNRLSPRMDSFGYNPSTTFKDRCAYRM